MTEGILLREMLADPLLQKFGVIIVDEAHERNILTDIVLGLLKKIIKVRNVFCHSEWANWKIGNSFTQKRDSLKIIIASATIDAEFFRDFFNLRTTTKTGSKKDSSIILSVEGRMYPVDVFNMQNPCPDYVKETVNTIMKIHEKEKPGDILAFLTGQEEVMDVVDLLREHIQDRPKDDLHVLPMWVVKWDFLCIFMIMFSYFFIV